MDLRGYLRAVRKYWWIVLLVTLIGIGAAAGLTLRAQPKYESTVTFFVSTNSEAAGTALQADQYAQRRVNSYAELLTTDRFARMVIAKSGVDLTVPQVMSTISASADLDTVLVTATVVDSSAERSLLIAKAVSTEFGRLVDQLDNKGVELNVVSGPVVNIDPISPRKALNLGLGFLAGLALGLALAILREMLDTTVRSLDVMRAVTNLPALGSIGYDSAAKKSPLLVGTEVRSIRAEAFRQLRTNLQFADAANPVQVIVVTSSVAAEGKSTTATNLAIVMAESGRRVLLIEADLRRPRVSDYLGLERAVGLTNVLAGQVDVEDVVQPWGTDNLMVLPSGSIPPNPSELLGSHSMADLVKQLRTAFDMIVIDTPPLLPVTDAAVASAFADGVMVVVRYGKASRTQLATAIQSLEAVDARILGCVLSMRPTKGADSQGGYDGYGYTEDKPVSSLPAVLLERTDTLRGKHAPGVKGDVKVQGAMSGEEEPDPDANDSDFTESDSQKLRGMLNAADTNLRPAVTLSRATVAGRASSRIASSQPTHRSAARPTRRKVTRSSSREFPTKRRRS